MTGKKRDERGSALITGLLIMLIMTGLGLASIKNTMLQQKMAGNDKDKQIAFQAAEAALREGELLLANADADIKSYIGSVSSNTNGCMTSPSAQVHLCYKDEAFNYKGSSTWSGHGKTVTTNFAALSTDIAEKPQFIIQHAYKLGKENANAFYITAKGVGAKSSTVIYLQSVFVVPN